MKNRSPLFLCTLFLLIWLFVCPTAWGAVHQVSISGQNKVWLDTNDDGVVEDGVDHFYTALYDDAQNIMVLYGNGTLLPDGENGWAYIYHLTGTPTGDRIMTEIDNATVNGVNYQNFNTVLHGLGAAVVTLFKKGGSPTYNAVTVQLGPNGSDIDVEISMLDGNGDGIYDDLNFDYAWGPYVSQGGNEWLGEGATFAFGMDTQQFRSEATLAGILQQLLVIDNTHWFDGDVEMFIDLWIPINNDDSITLYTPDEVLAGMPRNTNTWVEPPAPKYAGGPGGGVDNQGGDGGGDNPPYASNDDFWEDFCFVRSAHVPPYNPIHMSALSFFKQTRTLSVIALAGLGLFFVGGIVYMRRRGFGKDL